MFGENKIIMKKIIYSLIVIALSAGNIFAQYCGTKVDVPEGQRLRMKRSAGGKLELELEGA